MQPRPPQQQGIAPGATAQYSQILHASLQRNARASLSTAPGRKESKVYTSGTASRTQRHVKGANWNPETGYLHRLEGFCSRTAGKRFCGGEKNRGFSLPH